MFLLLLLLLLLLGSVGVTSVLVGRGVARLLVTADDRRDLPAT